MELCSKDCIPCCDFCLGAKHGVLEIDGTSGPIACNWHPDKEHQEIAEDCGFCDDFKCFMTEYEKK